MIASISEVSSSDYIVYNHLDINSAWKSLKCTSPARNEFASSVKSVHPQHKTRSSLAINLFVSSVIRIWRWVAETVTSLAMNVSVCSVKLCSEVSSRDCLVASDKCFCLLFESWFRNPSKRAETREKSFWKTSSQVRAVPVKRTETRQGWENSRTQPYYWMMAPPFWPPKQCTCIPSSLHAKWTRDASAMHWRPERKAPSLSSRVVFLSFSFLPCFCPFYRSSPNLKWSFFRNFFP